MMIHTCLRALLVLFGFGLFGCGAEQASDQQSAVAQEVKATSDQATVDAENLVKAVGDLHAEREMASPGGQVAFSCTYCHGRYGDNQSDYYPKLAGLPAKYIKDQLLAYREGRRDSLSMQSMALALSLAEIDQVSDFFASREQSLENVFLADEAQISKGKKKALTCVACHGPEERVDPNTPPLARQGYDYLVAQLVAYREGTRLDTNGVMPALVAGLSDADIEAIAHYYAAQ